MKKGKKQPKPGIGVKPKSGEVKRKIKHGGKRIWVIVKSGVVRAGKHQNGGFSLVELERGQYLVEREPHPNNPQLEALAIEDGSGEKIFVVESMLSSQQAEVQIIESDDDPIPENT